MGKIATKTIQYSIYDRTSGTPKYVDDTTTYKRPELEMLSDGFSGAGLMGEIDLPTIGQLGGMEGEITFNKVNSRGISLFTPIAHTIEIRWVTNTIDKSTGDLKIEANKEIIKMLPKSMELGDVEGNETNEGTLTFEVLTYQYILDGKTKLKVDKLNNVFIVDGKDYSEGVRNAL